MPFSITDTESNACFDRNPDGVVLLNRTDLTLRSANNTFLRLMGAPDNKLLKNLPLEEWLQSSTDQVFFDRLRTGDPLRPSSLELQSEIRRHDGSRVPVNLFISLLPEEDSGILIHVRDRSRDRESETILQLSLELDRSIQKGHSIETLMMLSVRRIAEIFPFLFTYFAIPEPDGSIRFLKIESQSPDIVQTLESSFSSLCWNQPPGNQMACGQAIQTQTPQYIFLKKQGDSCFPPVFQSLDLEATYAIPILRRGGGIPWGVLTVGIRQERDFTTKIQGQLLDFSEKIRLAFDHSAASRQNQLEKTALFEQAPDGIYILDPDSLTILDTNRIFCEMTGFSKEALVGKSLQELSFSSESLIRETIRKFQATKEHSLTIQRKFKKRDGSSFHVRVSFSSIPFNGKNALISHIRDISREIEQEVINRISFELDRKILKGSSIETLLSFIVDELFEGFGFLMVYFSIPEPDGTIRYPNIRSSQPDIPIFLQESSRTLRWNTPPGNRRVSAIVMESRRAQFVITKEYTDSPLSDAFYQAGVRAALFIPILREPESLLPWGTLTVSVPDERDLNEGIRSSLLELSNKIRMAFIRVEEQNRLRLLQTAMESVRSPFLITSPEGSIEWANAEFLRMIRQFPGDPRSIRIQDIFTDPVSVGESSRTLLEIIRAGAFFQGEVPGRTETGERIVTDTIVSPMLGAHGVLTHMLIHLKDVTGDREQSQEIWRLAHIDPMTELLNRSAFMDRLQLETRQEGAGNSPMALLFLDLDGFKEINDTLGHAAGDTFLRFIAERLTKCAGPTDIISRIGGDEFIILRPVDRPEDLEEFLQRLTREISKAVPLEGRSFTTTVSIGIALSPKDGHSEELLRKSDIAMYHAKKQGKNAWQFFTAEMEERIRHRYGEEHALQVALDHQEFFLCYQPQVDLIRKKVVGVEALVRWKTPDGKMVMPKNFIPLAEETGFILPLGEYVLNQAIGTIHRWIASELPPVRISVNISSRQFWNPSFWNTLMERIDIDPEIGRRLSIELTESLLVKDPDEAGSKLEALRKKGVRVSIDDFGTGYSSLAYLTRLPVDEIKVPQEFVLRMKDHARDGMMVKTIIQMAQNLGIDLVGEGAESQAEIGMLLDLGCVVLQGYGIARPAPLGEVESFISAFPEWLSGQEWFGKQSHA
ncbi:MAG: sensor domain-containing protein [Leptospirales bacterium]